MWPSSMMAAISPTVRSAMEHEVAAVEALGGFVEGGVGLRSACRGLEASGAAWREGEAVLLAMGVVLLRGLR